MDLEDRVQQQNFEEAQARAAHPPPEKPTPTRSVTKRVVASVKQAATGMRRRPRAKE